jgi:hypothetical protein
MAIDNIDKIDLIGTDKKSDKVILTISDHLDWENEEYHLRILQDKINTYLCFIESGEIYESYPSAKNKIIEIDIVGKYMLSENAKVFLENVKEVLADINILITFNLI